MFWDKLLKNRKYNLKNFRNTQNHNIFANWSPYKRGLSFHNYLIYNFIKTYPEKKILRLHKKLQNTGLGNPPGIIFKKRLITIDDCWTLEELIFLEKIIKKDQLILEIGAGYGRTAHAILNSFNIKKYFIIDLYGNLQLAKKYLKKILSKKNFDKIIFIPYEKFNFDSSNFKAFVKDKAKLKKLNNIDLTINIDSFGEMPPSLINKYLNFLKKVSKSFYFKNTVAKYKPRDLIHHLAKSNIPPKYNMELNFQKKIINVFDDNEISKYTKIYNKNFNPDNKKFLCKNFNSKLINFYNHAYYYLKK